MDHPPVGFKPAAWKVRNDRAAKGADARWVDKYAAYLACGGGRGAVRYPACPAMIGNHYRDTGRPYHISVFVPQFTQHALCGFLCSGAGDITIENDVDSYRVKIEDIGIGTGASGSHSLGDAQMVWTGPPIDSVAAHDLDRAIDVTDSDTWDTSVFEVTIDDKDASHSLRVYTVKFLPLYHDDTQLP
ncbi:MAG: hypothetical protein CMK74_01035 [Pseudomonadales bacterium]|jgi:hypothetical protein|nr:hypothetical protein [Pseudomonadales bacterium]